MTASPDAGAVLIDGRAHADRLKRDVAEGVRRFADTHGRPPGLAVVLVGEDPASAVYVRGKGEQSAALGMRSVTRRLPADASEDQVLREVATLNADPQIDGVLVQLPLPPHLDPARIVAVLDPDKDVDGLTIANAGRLASGVAGLAPCTPLGCMMLLQDVMKTLSGRRAVVVGRSNLMGKPMAQLLLQADCTVTIAHSKTKDLPEVCREADILVAAVGRAEFIRGHFLKPGAVVIDVGINRTPSLDPEKAASGRMRLVGDVAFAEARLVAAAITPVPGGVGPMTIACLLANTLTAARLRAGEI